MKRLRRWLKPNPIARVLPGGLAPLMVEAGRWSALEALDRTRLGTGQRQPGAVAALCPLLSEASALRLLQDEVRDPPDARELATAGLRSLLARLQAHPDALAAFWALPPAHRIQVASAIVTTQPAAITTDAFAHAERWWPPYDVTTALLDLLPWVPRNEREIRVRQALDLLDSDDPDDEFPIAPHHLGRIAAVDAELALSWASRPSVALVYPYLQDHAHIAVRLHGAMRERITAQWLSALERAKPQGARLTGTCIPAPLSAPHRAKLLALVDTRARPRSSEKAYVLVRLAAHDPSLLSVALGALRHLPAFEQALGSLALAPLVTDAERVRLLEVSLSLLRRYQGYDPPGMMATQQGWLGEDRRDGTRTIEDFRVEAIARLPRDARTPHLNALLDEILP